jgi:hypothetical protein
MASVRQAGVDDRQAVSEFLAGRLGSGGTAARFERLFDYAWFGEKPNLGWMIEDRGAVRGFVGAIYSRRLVRGRLQNFCNVHSFAVDHGYRSLSLPLLKQLLESTDQTYTCFSASPVALEILRFFKFHVADATKVMFTPASGLTRRLSTGVRLHHGAALADRLAPGERAIVDDHAGYRCGHFLLEADGARCYFVTVRRGRDVRAFADVLYASHVALLVKYIAHVHVPVALMHRTPLIALDLRLVGHRPAGTFLYSRVWPLAVKSAAVTVHDVDMLYSELVALYG